jgi:glycosyltransferase involved in cell wall biosynthesis
MKKLRVPKVVIDVERMKYPHTGLHNYCKNLAEFLVKDNSLEYHFFAPKKVALPEGYSRIDTKIVHKVFIKNSSKYDLWHGTYQTPKYLPRKSVKFVLTIHDLNFLYEGKSPRKRQKLLRKIQKAINRADYITAISAFALQDAQKHLDFKGKPNKVIHNGVNLLQFPEFDSPGYRPEKKFLFTLGTVLPKKNFHVLIAMMKSFENFELLIAGIHSSDEYLVKIQELIAANGLENRVHLLGGIREEEKFWYLKNCEAFMFPSLAEGFGIPVIEAMLLGKPVFLSKSTSLPEIGGKHAYYFENFEAEHMVEVVSKGLLDYKEHNKALAIKTWAEQFSWETASAAYREVYESLLS